MGQRAEVLSVHAQRIKLAETSDIDGYTAFLKQHFRGRRWLDHIASLNGQASQNGSPFPPDTISHLMLTGLITAQFGFDLLDAQLDRQSNNSWIKKVHGPEHQTATAIYMAKANMLACNIKDDILGRVELEEGLVPGIWGDALILDRGGIVRSWFDSPSDITLDNVRSRAQDRFRDSRPICLPDRELNRRLADVGFSNDMADRMPPEEFQRDYFPVVSEIVEDLVSPRTVFRSKVA